MQNQNSPKKRQAPTISKKKLKEDLVNGVIANLLVKMNPRWLVDPENRQFLSSLERPDILVTSYARQPIVLESEWTPASTVESDALSRLGRTLDPRISTGNQKVTSTIAIKLPTELEGHFLPAEIENMLLENRDLKFEYALFTGESSTNYQRFPEDGFLSGTIRDLTIFVGNASVSPDALEKAIRILSDGVMKVVHTLRVAASRSEDWKLQIAIALKQDFRESQSELDQMIAISATIMINALIFQTRLAGNQGIRSIDQMLIQNDFSQSGVVREWQKIMKINYWPIFKLAIDLLTRVNPTIDANKALRIMGKTAKNLIDLGIDQSHDLAGSVFQRYIGDRKFLASYYTRPESATLLANLAIPENGWESPEKVTSFSIADYACGTGTLIHAAYYRINQLHEVEEGEAEKLHSQVMSQVLTAVDVVPSAAHLTASMLSSIHPNVAYENLNVLIAEYGKLPDSRIAIGSLELMDKNALQSLFEFGSPTVISGKDEKKMDMSSTLMAKKNDLVIMNPPFTRAMSDWRKGAEGTWKQYRGLGNSEETQNAMKERETVLFRNSCYSGRAGIASAFVAIADLMVKDQGTVALVLPLTSIHGVSWQKVRKLIANEYENLVAIAIAQPKTIDQSWSADTNMAEVLLIANKRNRSCFNKPNRGLFVSLFKRPSNQMESIEIGKQILSIASDKANLQKLESSPVGGSPIKFGHKLIGTAIDAPITEYPWHYIPVKDLSIAQCMNCLSEGTLQLPRMRTNDAVNINISQVQKFARVGWAANNIANNQQAAFDRVEISDFPSYPMLWRSDSKIQKCMLVAPDMEGIIRRGKQSKAETIWKFRSNVHHAAEFGYSSQSLAAAYTETQTIGGRGWPNVQLTSELHEKAYCLWANSTLGIIQYWYHASRQQGARGIMPVTTIATMPFLDISSLSDQQLDTAATIFEKMKHKEFQPASKAADDNVRKQLDDLVLYEMLHLNRNILDEPLNLLREKWCNEPSV